MYSIIVRIHGFLSIIKTQIEEAVLTRLIWESVSGVLFDEALGPRFWP